LVRLHSTEHGKQGAGTRTKKSKKSEREVVYKKFGRLQGRIKWRRPRDGICSLGKKKATIDRQVQGEVIWTLLGGKKGVDPDHYKWGGQLGEGDQTKPMEKVTAGGAK